MTLQPIRAALASAFTACLLSATAIHAQPMPPGGAGVPRSLRGLDLSEAQQDRVFAILHAQAPRQRELEKSERKAHDALHAFRERAEFDQNAAKSQAQAYATAIAEQELLHLRTDAQLMALLTPEQRAQLRERFDGPPDDRGQARRSAKQSGNGRDARLPRAGAEAPRE